MTRPLAYLGLAEAADLIRAKQLSPVEYVTALLARIERHDAKYNAFIALTPERALTAARAAEAEIAAGTLGAGLFHGMPLCAEGHHRCRGSRDDGAFEDPDRPHSKQYAGGHGSVHQRSRCGWRRVVDKLDP